MHRAFRSLSKFLRPDGNARRWAALCAIVLAVASRAFGATTNVYLTGVPDYNWYVGCMGTASGNLMGYWDRHGFPDFYTGPLNGGLAPLTTSGANVDIVDMWATQAGVAGRPANKPGHIDDYYVTFYSSFEDFAPDPYLAAGRAEHPPDCLADFMGMDQMKWTNMANECSGNVDGYAFVYWATNGDRRVNFQPLSPEGTPVPDVQSGLRAWTRHRGYDATVFTQLTDFNPSKPLDRGFTYEDLKAEINAGYPVILFLQDPFVNSRPAAPGLNVNPPIHSMVAFGYYIVDGQRRVRYKTSWAQGDHTHLWNPLIWEAQLPLRGVIGFRPLPRIRNWSFSGPDLSLRWDGPASELYYSDGVSPATTNLVHGYVVERAAQVDGAFEPVSDVLRTNVFTITNCPAPVYVRIKLVKP